MTVTAEPFYVFEGLSYEDALRKADETDVWIVDEVIGATTTLIYGEAKVGKSFLASALIHSLTTGEDFIGRPVPQDRDFNIAVCWTDDAGAAEYGDRIRSVMPEDIKPKVRFYQLPIMRSQEMWQALYDEVMLNDHNFIVIDNLSQCLDGSVNDDAVVRRFYDGVRLFTRAGIPVVIIAHSTDKAGQNGFKSELPLGSAFISQASRWRCFVRRSRKGNLTLKFMGNYAEPHEITLYHGAGARFDLLDTKTAEQVKSHDDARKQQRSTEVLDANLETAEWVVKHCQGKGVNAAARELSEHKGKSAESWKSKIKRLPILTRTGEGNDTRWSIAA